MIKFKSLQSFCDTINELKNDDIQFKIIGTSGECHCGGYTGWEKPADNSFYVKLVALSALETFYCSEFTRLTDTEQISQSKLLLESFSIINKDINFKDGIVTVE